MGEAGKGPRHFTRVKQLPTYSVLHPCQSCEDEAEPWLLRLNDMPTRPDRRIWLCRQCSHRYLASATRDYGAVELRWEGG